MTFPDFFERATGNRPYPYQERLAESTRMPVLLRVPTGAGKTEASVLGWLYRRFQHPSQAVRDSTPRRLVYCLPMRTLVEQTIGRVEGWLENLDMSGEVGVVSLMGGEPRTQWYLEPEKPCIIIGTQDMLLSRALNRGYGSSPFMWPVEYGLLNSDCLWVMDEVQLMANGLPTSTQMAGLRRKLGTYGPSQSMWMSATVRPEWLATIDHESPAADQILELGDEDLASPSLAKRHSALKIVAEASVAGGSQYARGMATLIADRHVPGTLTLAIVNTVERAQQVFRALNNPRRVSVDAETVLVHSRFRAEDRRRGNDAVSGDIDRSGPGLIVVATQAVEAGVDISARTLVTEIAPWASMVQRFGRCNRTGAFGQADVLWVDVGERRQDTAPYVPEEVEPARAQMKSLEGRSVGPSDLEALGDVIEDADHLTVVRRRDVIGLFDTTPDLSGSYLDVSQYVRGGDERDVSVFWRDLHGTAPGPAEPRPQHSELVGVTLGKSVTDYMKDANRRMWKWDFLDNEWQPVQPWQLHPGMTLMLDAARGGYSPDTGWNPSNTEAVAPVATRDEDTGPEDGQDSDLNSTGQGTWVTLADHSRHVEAEVGSILNAVSRWPAEQDVREAVALAALYHDVGKAHPAFQDMLRRGGDGPPEEGLLLAKSPASGRMDPRRRHFRHEVGSALAVMGHAGDLTDRVRDLAAYLAASHHGKVRLGIRSLPGRRRGSLDSNPDPNYLLGYPVDEDEMETLPFVDLGDGAYAGETELDMSIAQIGVSEAGERSWLDRTLKLLEWLGPFRLAYLEAVVRAADMRASRAEREAAR